MIAPDPTAALALRAYVAASRAITLCEDALGLTAKAQHQVDRALRNQARKHWRCIDCDNLLATSIDATPGLTLICPECGMTWMSGTAA